MKITVAGLGYVGLSNAVLLAQRYEVTAFDINPSRVESVRRKISPINDADIQRFLQEETLNLSSTTDADAAFTNADLVIVATPTNYDPELNYFDVSSVEACISRDMLLRQTRISSCGRQSRWVSWKRRAGNSTRSASSLPRNS